jgi:signal transduction histidine kinase
VVVVVSAFALPWATLNTDVDPARPEDGGAAVLRLAAAAALAWRIAYPELTLIAVSLSIGIYGALGYPATLAAIAVWIAMFAVARYGRWGSRRFALLGLAVAALPLVSNRSDATSADAWLQVSASGLAVLAGLVIRRRDTNEASLEERAAHLEAERSAHVEAALAAERARIARDLHDVIAHGLGVIVVQATAGHHVHAGTEAGDSLHAVEQAARQAMSEMRTLLSVIRSDDQGHSSPPTIEGIADLVVRARAAGVETSVVERGSPRPLSPMIDLSLYRIAQESITNAIKHAVERKATIELVYGDDDVLLRVVTPGAPPADTSAAVGGFGLVGMRERVGVLAGTFSAGWDERGFVVEATLPTLLPATVNR